MREEQKCTALYRKVKNDFFTKMTFSKNVPQNRTFFT